ncbi:SnoaL-like domain-containing protein [Fontimonas thermophila]|uniref:SnoaL-like domain-containing protein n=1 Tax=Fontimonas thermophila TaxID=1076937 RepID=A0A1I2HBI4_9GAMM|nr:nuclear transport factor 2 family protein [Fontimonas thermophila]SFF26670.1 SnoaL-like domain-containing protein [Fontimonas thermophila]
MAPVDLAQRLQALEDIEAIRTLKARYLFCCDRKDPQGMRACFADGPVEIDYGVVGRFETADALVQVFVEIGCRDHMVEMHHGANPQIELLGPDHARGIWSLHYFLINTQERSLTQLGGYYEDEYRRIAGAWKITKTRFVATSTLVLDIASPAAKALFAGRAPPQGK